ncbi:hypothetical protein FRX31_010920, partial [Thalictrum thalictroides]
SVIHLEAFLIILRLLSSATFMFMSSLNALTILWSPFLMSATLCWIPVYLSPFWTMTNLTWVHDRLNYSDGCGPRNLV